MEAIPGYEAGKGYAKEDSVLRVEVDCNSESKAQEMQKKMDEACESHNYQCKGTNENMNSNHNNEANHNGQNGNNGNIKNDDNSSSIQNHSTERQMNTESQTEGHGIGHSYQYRKENCE
ncbi:MAG: hypothetical protein PHV15_07640 [Thomasclavelia ramosa]|nr:hypothetical protein [Lachnospira sp.]MDD8055740.1 hypothetical protein [Thomasclavelia ramosa]